MNHAEAAAAKLRFHIYHELLQVADGKVDLASVSKQYKAGAVLPARITDLSGTAFDLGHEVLLFSLGAWLSSSEHAQPCQLAMVSLPPWPPPHRLGCKDTGNLASDASITSCCWTGRLHLKHNCLCKLGDLGADAPADDPDETHDTRDFGLRSCQQSVRVLMCHRLA